MDMGGSIPRWNNTHRPRFLEYYGAAVRKVFPDPDMNAVGHFRSLWFEIINENAVGPGSAKCALRRYNRPFVRHGQGFHNLGAGFYSIRDPGLTPLGEEQCEILRNTSFPDQSNISLTTASPLCRIFHTALLTFNPALTSNSKCPPQILALPDAQETSDELCDIGSDPSLLRGIVAENNWPVDLSPTQDGWNVKTLENRYNPHSSAMKARAHDARILLRQEIRELIRNGDIDAQVIRVTHGGYLHYFTDDWEDSY
ncbi:hypothetical protein MMC28_008683 [Mycoblastus sanguinarius]|nr:hypothetical protein [Mycoblastus sanguinarius]